MDQPFHVPTEPRSTSTPTNSSSILNAIGTISAPNQSIINATINILVQLLRDEWKRQRAPQGLRRKLLETRTSEATVTARIFLDHGGFKAWIAYFLATEGKAHFKGRHDRAVTIAAFENLSSDDRINAARRVAGIQPHSTADVAIQQISQALKSSGKLSNHSTFLFFCNQVD